MPEVKLKTKSVANHSLCDSHGEMVSD